MALAPLSHHEIVGLVGPFTQAGWRLDLAASARERRQLVFQCPQDATLRLELQGLPGGSWQLTRWAEAVPNVPGPLASEGPAQAPLAPLRASVQAVARPPAELLAGVERVPVARHWRAGPGWCTARSYRIAPDGSAHLALALVQVQHQKAGNHGALLLSMQVSPVRGVAVELALVASSRALALPEDLLAVLGWNWTRLVPQPPGVRGNVPGLPGAIAGWTTRLRLRCSGARRTAAAEAACDRVAAHLAQTLAEPPARFHERHRAARLGVVARRAIPLATPLVLVTTILAMPRLDFAFGEGPGPGWWLLLYHLPTMLIMLSFTLQELPTLAPPPWPRRNPAPHW
jgi:hypothetical protein